MSLPWLERSDTDNYWHSHLTCRRQSIAFHPTNTAWRCDPALGEGAFCKPADAASSKIASSVPHRGTYAHVLSVRLNYLPKNPSAGSAAQARTGRRVHFFIAAPVHQGDPGDKLSMCFLSLSLARLLVLLGRDETDFQKDLQKEVCTYIRLFPAPRQRRGVLAPSRRLFPFHAQPRELTGRGGMRNGISHHRLDGGGWGGRRVPSGDFC